MENGFCSSFPKLCSSVSVSKRLFVFKMRKTKKLTFIVHFLGASTVLSTLCTLTASMNLHHFHLNLLSAFPPLSPTSVWLLFTTILRNSSCQGLMTLNPVDVFQSSSYLTPQQHSALPEIFSSFISLTLGVLVFLPLLSLTIGFLLSWRVPVFPRKNLDPKKSGLQLFSMYISLTIVYLCVCSHSEGPLAFLLLVFR